MTLDLKEIEAARERITGVAIRTPLIKLNAESPTGAEVYLKLENLQPIGAYKIRGALNAIRQMTPEQLRDGVLTASAGNMAQGVAWAAREAKVSCAVVAPDTAPDAKISAIERLGGRVITVSFERWWQTFTDRSFPGENGAFVHPFDDERVMAGNGTIGLEILEDLPECDAILAPWGGGGLACGIASAVKAKTSRCAVYAVEVDTGAPLGPSLAAGHPVTVTRTATFIDSMGSTTVFPSMFQRAQALLDGALCTSVAAVGEAIRTLVSRNHVVAEGAGAAALAVAMSGRPDAKRLVCVVSGGNIDLATLAQILIGPAC
jgi:threonine dehydratase